MNLHLLSSYDYTLPEGLIAQVPIEPRDASRLLHVERFGDALFDRRFPDLVDLLESGDVLVVNNTRVNAVKLDLVREGSGGSVEVLLLKSLGGPNFLAMMKPAKRQRKGTRLIGDGITLEVTEELPEGQRKVVALGDNWSEALQRAGQVPLPPYIHEKLTNPERYQTVYASQGGSAAAPTAGLHFTPGLFEALGAKGVTVAEVTLDVGIDTFKPVQADDLTDHVMHGETYRVSDEAASAINGAPGRVICVGTTSVRTVESAGQSGKVEAGSGLTRLFITPGFEFQIVQGLLTNFHLPRTTMLMMLASFCGHERLFRAYDHAISGRYRFLSFGDAMLII